MRIAWLVPVLLALPAAASEVSVRLVLPATDTTRAVESWLEVQVELHRRGFSCGSIDGIVGTHTRAALRAFQRNAGLAESGDLDLPTSGALQLAAPALGLHTFTAADLASLGPVADTWLGKSGQSGLPYVTALELAAERYRAAPGYLRRLNPATDWEAITEGTQIQVPAVERALTIGVPAQIVIRLEAHELEVIDAAARIVARFPVSIGRQVERRPVGELRVTVRIRNPNYTFDPAIFPESIEGATLGRRLTVPPGPNNPVGLAWIGLDRPGYGIHGTPEPENIGRTESHGCFRLANWDAVTLLGLVHLGMTVMVEP
jgi:lipoprotein-anchoring transpeptidase ErfK/SrfK